MKRARLRRYFHIEYVAALEKGRGQMNFNSWQFLVFFFVGCATVLGSAA